LYLVSLLPSRRLLSGGAAPGEGGREGVLVEEKLVLL